MIKAVIFDLDGTLYIGRNALPGAPEKLEELRSKGVKTLFLTNDATKNRDNVSKKLLKMGLKASKEEIYTSAYALATYLKENHPGKKVFVVGETGLHDELHEAGLETVENAADIVVTGLDKKFDYEKLASALRELKNGAAFFATNYDPVFPVEGGCMPGAGSIVASIETASGKKSEVIGKPNVYIMKLIEKEHGLRDEELLMVGDRLDTDISFAKNCGIKSVLVLSGVSKKSDIKDIKPDYVLASVSELSLP